MSLPKVPYKMAKNRSQMVSLKSINYTDMLQDGDVVDSKNISARAYPYITTRKARRLIDSYKNVEAITVFGGKIAYISGGKFFYDGQFCYAVMILCPIQKEPIYHEDFSEVLSLAELKSV